MRRLLLFVVILAVLGAAGCAPGPEPMPPGLARPCPVKVLALAPFQAPWPGQNAGEVICPVTQEIYVASPIPEAGLKAVTRAMPKAVSQVFTCRLITSRQLSGYLPVQPDQPGAPIRHALAQAGREAGAGAVLVGTLLRYRERDGSEVAITRPASVHLGLYLIDANTAEVLWRGFFDETQVSLAENLFRLEAFVERGGRWLTAADLAQAGMREILRQMPGGVANR